MARYRIRPYTRLEYQYGYEGRYPVRYQDLQVKRWWGWQTLGTETVPEWEWSYNAVGGSGWRSTFADFGSWDRDGVVTPHSPD